MFSVVHRFKLTLRMYVGGVVQSEVEETLKRIQGHKGVLGVVIFDKNGMWCACVAFRLVTLLLP